MYSKMKTKNNFLLKNRLTISKIFLASIVSCSMALIMGCSDSSSSSSTGPDDDVDDVLTLTDTIVIGSLAEIQDNSGAVVDMRSIKEYELAAYEINMAGGVLGKALKIDHRDSRNEWKENAESFLADDVTLIAGPGWSSRTLKVADTVGIDGGMLLMSYSATSPDITNHEDKNLIWRVCPSTLFGLSATADGYFADGLRKAAVIYQDDAFGKGTATAFLDYWESIGGEAVGSGSHEPDLDTYDDVSFNEIIDDVMAGEPDIIMYVSFGLSEIKMLSDMSTNDAFLAKKPILLSPEGNDADAILANIDPVMHPLVFTLQNHVDTTTKSYLNFAESYKANYSAEPDKDFFKVDAYDVIYLFAMGIVSANSTNGVDVAKTLSEVSQGGTKVYAGEWSKIDSLIQAGEDVDYDGASGEIEFDTNGDIGFMQFTLDGLDATGLVNTKTITYTKP